MMGAALQLLQMDIGRDHPDRPPSIGVSVQLHGHTASQLKRSWSWLPGLASRNSRALVPSVNDGGGKKHPEARTVRPEEVGINK